MILQTSFADEPASRIQKECQLESKAAAAVVVVFVVAAAVVGLVERGRNLPPRHRLYLQHTARTTRSREGMYVSNDP